MTTQNADSRGALRLGESEYGLLADLRREGKRTLALPEDRPIVDRHSTRPTRLLSQMARKGLLKRVRRGHYVVLGPGGGARHEVPAFVALDAALGKRRYAISFLSALAYHGLTDHEPHAITVIAEFPDNQTAPKKIAGFPVDVRVSRRSEDWFGIRWQEDALGAFRIADPERAVIDSIASPALAGGPEVVVRALARGLGDSTLRVTRLVRYAENHSTRVARALGYLLELLEVPQERLAPLQSQAKKTRRYDLLFNLETAKAGMETSAEWRIRSAIPASTIRAWGTYQE